MGEGEFVEGKQPTPALPWRSAPTPRGMDAEVRFIPESGYGKLAQLML
jgi:hypothetical protein